MSVLLDFLLTADYVDLKYIIQVYRILKLLFALLLSPTIIEQCFPHSCRHLVIVR